MFAPKYEPVQQASVVEILPENFDEEGRFDPESMGAEKGIMVILISNPHQCGHCKKAEPEFFKAADQIAAEDIGDSFVFATFHKYLPQWRKVPERKRREMTRELMPFATEDEKASLPIPFFSVLIDGEMYPFTPLDRKAETLYGMMRNLYTAYLKGHHMGRVTSMAPPSGIEWTDDDVIDQEDYIDDQRDFSAIMANAYEDSRYADDAPEWVKITYSGNGRRLV